MCLTSILGIWAPRRSGSVPSGLVTLPLEPASTPRPMMRARPRPSLAAVPALLRMPPARTPLIRPIHIQQAGRAVARKPAFPRFPALLSWVRPSYLG